MTYEYNTLNLYVPTTKYVVCTQEVLMVCIGV